MNISELADDETAYVELDGKGGQPIGMLGSEAKKVKGVKAVYEAVYPKMHAAGLYLLLHRWLSGRYVRELYDDEMYNFWGELPLDVVEGFMDSVNEAVVNKLPVRFRKIAVEGINGRG